MIGTRTIACKGCNVLACSPKDLVFMDQRLGVSSTKSCLHSCLFSLSSLRTRIWQPFLLWWQDFSVTSLLDNDMRDASAAMV